VYLYGTIVSGNLHCRPGAAISTWPYEEWKFFEDFYEIAAFIEDGTSFLGKRIVYARHYHFRRHGASGNRGNCGMRGICEFCLGTKEQDRPKVVRMRDRMVAVTGQ